MNHFEGRIMKIVRLEKSPVLRLATLAVVAAAIAGTAGIAADQSRAATGPEADRASHGAKEEFKRPKVKHGVLTVKGTHASEKIVLRLNAGATGVVEGGLDAGE